MHVPDYAACLIPNTDQPKLTCVAERELVAEVFWDPVEVGTDPETGAPIIAYRRRVEKQTDVWSWSSAACLETLRERLMDGFCRSQTRCTRNADAACVAVPGGQLCGSELVRPPSYGETGSEPWEQFSGIGAACMQVSVALDCTSFHIGRMDCWTDPQGVKHCPENPGDRNTCAALVANPHCREVSRTCAEAATGRSGVCYVEQLVYDCGTAREIQGLERRSELDCGGAVRCLGDACVAITPEASTQFDEAVAALHAAELVALDADCSTGSCQVFQGEALTCKRAVGGIVNCCERPSGVSLGLYLQLMFSIAQLDQVTLALVKAGQSTPAFGAWETLRAPLVDTWSAVKDAFTSAVNNLTGNTTAVTTEVAKQGLIARFKQQLLKETVQWTAEVFGPQAANTLFVDAAGGGAAIGSDGTIASQLALNPQITVVVQWVLWAYLVYSIVMILIQLIWTCTEDEFRLGVQRELQACHRVGAYCKKNLFGACIESRDSYHPATLLSLLLYGYATGCFSIRQIERATHDSFAFRFIAANAHPDHATLATFRKRFAQAFEAVVVQVLQVARESQLSRFGTVSLDGTKIHANASRHSALSDGHAEYLASFSALLSYNPKSDLSSASRNPLLPLP